MKPFLDSKASWWYSFPPAGSLFPLVFSQLLSIIKTWQQFLVVGSSTASSSWQRFPQRENPFLSLVTNRFAGPTLSRPPPALQNQATPSPEVNNAQLTAQSIPLSALLSHPGHSLCISSSVSFQGWKKKNNHIFFSYSSSKYHCASLLFSEGSPQYFNGHFW